MSPHAEELDDPNDVEIAWAQAIERRSRELREGTVTPIPSADVFDEVDAILAAARDAR